MHPILISLQPEYRAELLDPLHRHLELSNWLYAQWEIAINTLSTDLTFPAWINANHGNTRMRSEVVSYISPNHLAHHQVTFNNNGEAINSGSKLTCELDYRRKEKPIALIIMPNNQLYATSMNTSADHSYRVHHSSLSSGGDVFFAAEAYAKDGVFSKITDKSGHYKPNLYSFVYGLSQMIAAGADLSTTKIEVNSYDPAKLCTFYLGDQFVNRYFNFGFDARNFRGTFNSIEEANIDYNNEGLESQPEAIYFIREQNDLFTITKIDNLITLTSFSSQFKQNEENDIETLVERKAERRRAAMALAEQEEPLPQFRLVRDLQARLEDLVQQNANAPTLFDSPPSEFKRIRFSRS